MGPGSFGLIGDGGEVIRLEECAVSPISWVCQIAGAVIRVGCGIHISNDDGCTVIVCVHQGSDFLLHLVSTSEGFVGASRGPVGAYQQEIGVATF